jgi:hypothetical protein
MGEQNLQAARKQSKMTLHPGPARSRPRTTAIGANSELEAEQAEFERERWLGQRDETADLRKDREFIDRDQRAEEELRPFARGNRGTGTDQQENQRRLSRNGWRLRGAA